MSKQVKDMIKIWAIGMCVILIVGVGIFSLVLTSRRVQYGLAFNLDLVNSVEVWSNAEAQNILFVDQDRPSVQRATAEIMHLLQRGGRTNEFVQLFRGSGEERVSFATTNNNTHQIRGNNDHLYIKINFRVPQFGISGTSSADFRLVPASEVENPRTMRIWQIFIPLGNQTNTFQEQRWFINTSENPNDTIQHMFTTWGNYYQLAAFVRDLQMV